MTKLQTRSSKSINIGKKLSLDEIRQQIVGVDTKAPALDGRLLNYVNFDNAASTPSLATVLETINNFMPWYSSVHRGTGFKSIVATEAYEDSRQTVADFFGANSDEHVVLFGKNSTEALNKLSYRLKFKKTDVILVSLMEHHSNDLPWRGKAQIKRIEINETGQLDEEHFKQLLETYGQRVKLVCITGGSNVTGIMPDIHKLARLTHQAGAQILVDCAQLAPHRQIKVKRLSDPEHLDYIVASAHKMYAPYGTGVLVGRRDTFEHGQPEYCGGGTIDLVTTSKVEWADLPDRDEAGSPNVVGAIAFAASLKFLNKIGMTEIAGHEADLTAYTLSKLQTIPGVELYGDTNPANSSNRLGVIPFNIDGMSHFLVAAILGTEGGVGVRNGCFCAHPYITRLLHLKQKQVSQMGKEVLHGNKSQMPGMVRISFGMYNTTEEVDHLIDALKNISLKKYQGKYTQDIRTGEYKAAGWHPKVRFI